MNGSAARAPSEAGFGPGTLPRAVKRTWILRGAWTLASLAAAVVLTRSFVGDVYHVDSGSMAPALWGEEGDGEWVFVRYDTAPPARQEVIVVQRNGDDAPIVKRVVGLPGESIQVSHGDVLVRGQRLASDEPRPPWILVYDQAREPLEERFPVAPAQAAQWTLARDAAELDAREVPRDANLGLLFLHDPLTDEYLGPNGERVRGTSPVNDARIECEITCRDAGSQLRVGLNEQGDTFQALVRPLEGGEAEIAITRRNAAQGLTTLASARVRLALDEPRHLAFENRDNVVRLELEGAPPLVAGYRENERHPADRLQEGGSYGYRAWFGGEEGRFTFRRVRVLRDIAYTERGTFGIGAPLALGPDEWFVLGDRSNQSRDSREWGPVHAREIVGRPVWVVWPPSRWRRVGGAERPAP